MDFRRPKRVVLDPSVVAAKQQEARANAKIARDEAKKSKSSIYNFFGRSGATSSSLDGGEDTHDGMDVDTGYAAAE